MLVNAKDENQNQATYASLDKNLIRALEFDWKFVTVEKVGKHRWISLTKEGKYASEFLLDKKIDVKYVLSGIPRYNV